MLRPLSVLGSFEIPCQTVDLPPKPLEGKDRPVTTVSMSRSLVPLPWTGDRLALSLLIRIP